MAEERKKALDAGCDEYDTKPIEFEGLLKKINKLIGEWTKTLSPLAIFFIRNLNMI